MTKSGGAGGGGGVEDGRAVWTKGYGAIRHAGTTRRRIADLEKRLDAEGVRGDGLPLYDLLHAADRIASAGMWLVVHETYARRVRLDGKPLGTPDFKPVPEGHTGGSLNMVPAYAGYLAANAISGHTRGWIMGQGHCVAAIDSVNLLVGNLSPPHVARYAVTDDGLTRYVRDFYGFRLREDGTQESPLGSHVNPNTAGGISEGGYLGFAELQWVHMPLPGERLVAFLSDGAFEEQRGSDWAPRWWRGEDSGLVAPIMIANGRRIDQRTTMSQQGGVGWLSRHLKLNGFDPIVFDGRDPAAFAWAILEIEERLERAAARIRKGEARYPVRLPYGIAVTTKGFGCYGAGTNLAHNLPLGGNPSREPEAARRFRRSVRRLHVPEMELREAAARLSRHEAAGRPREKDHPLADRRVEFQPAQPAEPLHASPHPIDHSTWLTFSPMVAVDEGFLAAVRANPGLRPRVGNPDEMRSNRLVKSLEALRFRVTAPETGIPEAVDGAVITALNEEAVASAALANKGGINLVATYEAFGMKMHGAFRQEIIFADECAECGRPPGWLSIPLVLTSHTWENAKNERSHQDPSMAEALLGEPSNVSRVLFVPDAPVAATAIRRCFETRGQFWTLVVPKTDRVPVVFASEEAARLVDEGAIEVRGAGHEPGRARLVLTAVGGYQLAHALRASSRLRQRGVAHAVVSMLEPGRFREARGPREQRALAPRAVVERLYSRDRDLRLFLSHTRPEVLLGVVEPLRTGAGTRALGYANQGGTLSTEGLLFRNRATWAHALDTAAGLLGVPRETLLDPPEIAALDGRGTPHGTVVFDVASGPHA